MKSFIPAILMIVLVSCSKETLTAPAATSQRALANVAVAYKDNSISVIDFKALQDNGSIDVTFTTLYQKNIVKLEILKGVTANNLCSIYQQAVKADSYSSIKYTTSDGNSSNAATLYYMVKYTMANGDWGYTPVFQLSL